jgi:hypothetical protein
VTSLLVGVSTVLVDQGNFGEEYSEKADFDVL